MRSALVLGLILAASAAPASASPKIWTQDWKVNGAPKVKIVADDAHVRLHSGSAGAVYAKVSYELKHWGLVIGGGEPTVMFERQGDQITITAKDPKGFGVVGGVEESFAVDVTLPPEVELNVRTSDGAIDCEPMGGTFMLRSGDGAIRAHGLRGSIDYSSDDGRIIMTELDGRITGLSRDGSAKLSGRFDVVDLSSSDGRIELEALRGSRAAGPWSIETKDGSLSLRIPVDFAALLDARTKDGGLRVTLPIEAGDSRRSHELMGELNGGGPRLRLRTADGTLSIGLSE